MSRKKSKSGEVNKISALELKMKEIVEQNRMLHETISALSTKERDGPKRGPLINTLNQRNVGNE